MKTRDSELRGAESVNVGGRGDFPDLEQVPLFSRNLEVNVKKSLGENGQEKSIMPELADEDRMIYFQVEAGKIVDIIERDISMLERNRFSSNLVSDMYESWITLWGDDDAFPVGRFTELFEVVCEVLNSMVEMEHKPELNERLAIEKVVGAMRKLAGGNSDLAALESMNRYVEQLKGIAERFERGENSPVTHAGAAEEKVEIIDDISSSVDNWFKQASGYASEVETKKTDPEPVSRIKAYVREEKPVTDPPVNIEKDNFSEDTIVQREFSEPDENEYAQDDEFNDNMEPDIVPDIVTAYLREKTDETARLLEYNSELITSDKPSRTARFVLRQFEELRDLTLFMSIPETLELIEEARIVLSDSAVNGKVAGRSIFNGSGKVDTAVCKLEELGNRLGSISVETLY